MIALASVLLMNKGAMSGQNAKVIDSRRNGQTQQFDGKLSVGQTDNEDTIQTSTGYSTRQVQLLSLLTFDSTHN